jgi:glycosyltransferase involved in cell wall biosynthesis
VAGPPGSNTVRYRVRFAEEALRSRGIRTRAVHFTDPASLTMVGEADVLALYRVPQRGHVLELVRRARLEHDIPVTYDIDDLVFRGEHLDDIPFLDDLGAGKRATFERDTNSRARVIGLADRLSGSTTPVVDELRSLTDAPVEVLPNGLSRRSVDLAAACRRRDADGRVRLGYFSGSATHERDWMVVQPAVVDLLASDSAVDLWLVGPLSGGPELSRFGNRVRRVEAVEWWELPALISQVDINLAPLETSPFTNGKSTLKWMEAAMVGVPTVASATQPFRETVEHGETALLARDTDDWRRYISDLIADRSRRDRMAGAARRQVMADLSPDRQAARYEAYFRAAVEGPRLDVEVPPKAVELEPFEFPPELDEFTFGVTTSQRSSAVISQHRRRRRFGRR